MKYLNFEGLQYFYSKLSSSLASRYVSLSNLKTINGQSLTGSGNISLLSNPISGTLTVGGTPSNVPTINIKRDDTPYPAIILNEGGSGGLASITFQHAGTGALGTTINRDGVTIAGKSSSDLLTAAGSTTSLKTINNQSLLGSGNITIEGGASGDGNYYPTAMSLTNSGNRLTGSLTMSGISNLNASGPYFATINGTSIIGATENNIAIDWNSLNGKPDWVVNKTITWGDISGVPSFVQNVTINGTPGNAIVDASYSGGTLTLTKGTISASTSGITQSEADNRYVNVSGDTMTGALTVTSGGITLGRGEVVLSDRGGIKITGIVPQTGSDRTKAALYIDTQGSDPNALGISTTGKISVDGVIDAGGQIQSSTGFYSTGTAYIKSEIRTDSNVTAAAFYESSDVSLKENIAPITKEAIDAVDCLTFKQFNFKDDKDKTTKYGVIAQEVEAVGLGNLVKDNGETKSVDYISLLILKIESLEKRITELEEERR